MRTVAEGSLVERSDDGEKEKKKKRRSNRRSKQNTSSSTGTVIWLTFFNCCWVLGIFLSCPEDKIKSFLLGWLWVLWIMRKWFCVCVEVALVCLFCVWQVKAKKKACADLYVPDCNTNPCSLTMVSTFYWSCLCYCFLLLGWSLILLINVKMYRGGLVYLRLSLTVYSF